MSEQTTYIPGVCNIGRAEIGLRWQATWLGAGLAVVIAALLIALRAWWPLALIVFFPASVATISFQQAFFHFCVKFARSGVFNFGPEVGKTDTVAQAEFRQKDRATAVRMLTIGIGLAIALTATLAWGLTRI